MELKELAKKSLLKHGEVFVGGVLNDVYDPSLDAAKEQLKGLIKGQADDLVIDLIVGHLGPVFKAELLKAVAKISDEV